VSAELVLGTGDSLADPGAEVGAEEEPEPLRPCFRIDAEECSNNLVPVFFACSDFSCSDKSRAFSDNRDALGLTANLFFKSAASKSS
jgi:hypothetical protein